MPSMSETDGMENMLGKKESTEGRRSKGALLASKRKTSMNKWNEGMKE